MPMYPCVILAGGLGTRLRESTEFRPKPMIEIDSKPIVWHILKSYHHYGINDFIISAGYKSEIIKNYFLHYNAINLDIKINYKDNKIDYFGDMENWNVIIADTGLDTMTGGRISKIKKYVSTDTFLCTYGDGVSDVNINKLLDFHKNHGKVATMMVVKQPSRFGVVELDSNLKVNGFREKPTLDGWVNAGYFVFNKSIFDYLDDNSTLENEPLMELANQGELMAYQHDGFWQAMDTYREQVLLENLIKSNNAPWMQW
jgi:glucose-1-phosphate cytidylyltransferase